MKDTFALELEADRIKYFAAALVFPVLACLFFLVSRTSKKRGAGEEASPRRRFFVFLFAGFNAFASFYFVELLYNTSLYHMELKYKLLGWGITAAVDLIFIGLANSVSIGMMAGNIFFMVFGLVNFYVAKFRSLPFQYVDIFSARTAAGVASKYTYVLTWQMTVMISFLLSAALFYINEGRVRIFKALPLRILLRGAAVLLAAVFVFGCMKTSFLADTGIVLSDFSPQITYKEFGTEASFLAYAKQSIPEKPEGYSAKRVREIIAEAGTGEAVNDEEKAVPENIIVIMNESFSDFSIYPGVETSEPVTPFFSSITENAQRGPLLVSVRGGWTANTEYEFLTGNSCMYSPGTVVYNSFIRDDQYAVPRTLKAQGYRTVALHPYYRNGWNRNTVYPRMGFDEFIDMSAFKDVELTRWCVGDYADYDEVIRLVEEKEEGEKLFIFNVTMQNHGGYNASNFEADVHAVGYDGENAGEVNQYLSLIRLSDEALEYLIDYFSKSDEKTLILFFGDHQPAFDEQFFRYAFGREDAALTFEETQKTYETCYLFWANYEIPESVGERMSVNYLGSRMLELTGLTETGYNAYVTSLRDTVPVVNAFGYETADGTMHEHGSGGGPEAESLLSDYECLIYNELTGGQARDDSFFGLG